jgi:hypothetical protein
LGKLHITGRLKRRDRKRAPQTGDAPHLADADLGGNVQHAEGGFPADTSPASVSAGIYSIHPLIAERSLRARMEAAPLDMDLKFEWIRLQHSIAVSRMREHAPSKALARLIQASRWINEMLMFDPANESWSRLRDDVDADLKEIALAEGTCS